MLNVLAVVLRAGCHPQVVSKAATTVCALWAQDAQTTRERILERLAWKDADGAHVEARALLDLLAALVAAATESPAAAAVGALVPQATVARIPPRG